MNNWNELFRKSKIIKSKYPKGTRVEAIFINDKNAPPIGEKGTVSHVDDIGTVFVDWDSGKYVSGVVLDEDEIKKIKEEE